MNKQFNKKQIKFLTKYRIYEFFSLLCKYMHKQNYRIKNKLS